MRTMEPPLFNNDISPKTPAKSIIVPSARVSFKAWVVWVNLVSCIFALVVLEFVCISMVWGGWLPSFHLSCTKSRGTVLVFEWMGILLSGRLVL